MLLPFSAPIVGAKFRPPAADVLNNMAGESPLVLVREPENPHDANAIAIKVAYDNIKQIVENFLAGEPEAENQLIEFMSTKLDAEARLHLGYIPRDKAESFAPWIDKMGGSCAGKLAFNLEGRPQVTFEIDDELTNEEAVA